MFKGESRLDVFKNEDALINLINLFSMQKNIMDIHKSCFPAKKAEEELALKAKLNDSKKKKYKILESEISLLRKEIEELQTKIKNSDKELFNYNNQKDQLKKKLIIQSLLLKMRK